MALLAALRRIRLRCETAATRRAEDRRYRRGNDFEDHVARMFDPSRFELVHRTPTHAETGGRFVESMAWPDLRLVERSTGRGFWVEVKFRSHPGYRGSVEWCTEKQLGEYRRAAMESGLPVLLMMGVGGTVRRPARVYCVDVSKMPYTTLYYGTYVGKRVRGKVRDLDSLLETARA